MWLYFDANSLNTDHNNSEKHVGLLLFPPHSRPFIHPFTRLLFNIQSNAKTCFYIEMNTIRIANTKSGINYPYDYRIKIDICSEHTHVERHNYCSLLL